jgi:pimeloyl-ACP methyl ester carboxylesterase
MLDEKMMGLPSLGWIVIPGGPGLSADYLKVGLSHCLAGQKWHFYDPPGSPSLGEQSIPSLRSLVSGIFQFAKERQLTRYGLITHSFGNYLAMRALERSENKVCALVMISPMSFAFTDWQKALAQIASGVPQSILNKIHQLTENKKTDPDIFNALLPYYAKKLEMTLPEIPLNLAMCDGIAAQVGTYDDTSFLIEARIPWCCIVGEKDPFLKASQQRNEKMTVIPGVGHYPFFEDTAAFSLAMNAIFSHD